MIKGLMNFYYFLGI